MNALPGRETGTHVVQLGIQRHVLGDDTAWQSNAKRVRSSFLWHEDGGRFRGVDSGLPVAVGIFVGLALLFGIISSWLVQYNAVPTCTYLALVRRHVGDVLVWGEVQFMQRLFRCPGPKCRRRRSARSFYMSSIIARTCTYRRLYNDDTYGRLERKDKASLEARWSIYKGPLADSPPGIDQCADPLCTYPKPSRYMCIYSMPELRSFSSCYTRM